MNPHRLLPISCCKTNLEEVLSTLQAMEDIQLELLSRQRGRKVTMDEVKADHEARSLDYRRQYENYKKEFKSSLKDGEIKDWNELC
jgi:hypothetical protein